jgi:multidrug efflux pump
MYVSLKPLNQRKFSAQQVIARIRKKVSNYAGLSLYLQAQQDLRIGGRSSNAEYQYTLTSDDLGLLMEWAPKLLARLRAITQLTDVSSDQQNAGLAANLTIDHDSAARFGLSTQLIDDTLYDAFGQREVSTMYTPLNQYYVVVEVAPQFWQDPETLDVIHLSPNLSGTQLAGAGAAGQTGIASASSAAGSNSSVPPSTLPPVTGSQVPGVATTNGSSSESLANIGSQISGTQTTTGSSTAPVPTGSVDAGIASTDASMTQSGSSSSSAIGATTTAAPNNTAPVIVAGATPPSNPGFTVIGATNTSPSSPASTAVLTTASVAHGMVPIGAISRYTSSTTPLTVNHQGQFPAVTMSFNLASGVALGDAVGLINQAEQDIHLPAPIHGTFAGTAQAFQASLANEPMLIAAALLSVYIVLGILYESYVHPITILSTLPSAGIGALLALQLCHIDLSVIALIGIILLIGIVKKNAILMIDLALEAERKQGKSSEDAIYQACVLRFRPIMMTTMAALLGGLPLALGTGYGSELRRPLGVTIVGGLIVSQMLTLYTTPVIYLYLDRLRLWGLGLIKRRPQAGSLPTTAET